MLDSAYNSVSARWRSLLAAIISPAPDDRALRTLAMGILVAAPIYGAFMGSFEFADIARLKMVAYAAIKAPLLIGITSLFCLPAFFVINTILGLRADFAQAMRAILAAQTALAVALASMGPLIRFIYFCGVDHRWALLSNAAVFSVATAVAQVMLFRRYRPLIRRTPHHRITLWFWIVLYAFVGMQMGWMLRPFVGSPGMAVTFFRNEPFTNAYVEIFRLFVGNP